MGQNMSIFFEMPLPPGMDGSVSLRGVYFACRIAATEIELNSALTPENRNS